MSYVVIVRIECDHEGCDEVWWDSYRNRGGLNKTWAGYVAARQGWYVRGASGSTDPKVAYCPTHRAEHGK